MGKLEGKTALITGTDRGIGLATAKHLVKEGAYVILAGQPDSELAAVVDEIGQSVIGVPVDMSNLVELDRLIATIRQETGWLDIVFATADAEAPVPAGDITDERYFSVSHVNVMGIIFTVLKAIPLMPDGASIIVNTSIVTDRKPLAYSVRRAATATLRSFARAWATELKDRGVRVNAVNSGPSETLGRSDSGESGQMGNQHPKEFSLDIPHDGHGNVREIAKAVAFLASDESSHISATELFADHQLLSNNVLLGKLGTPDDIANAVVFLASEDSSDITGMELFVGAGLARL